MGLAQTIQADLTTAMKARDAETVATLRLVVAAVRNQRVAEGHTGEVSDAETVQLVTREAKKRTDAAEAYDKAGREEQAAAERRELEILRRYLPAQLSDDELAGLVGQAVADTGASGPGDLGRVMSAVLPKVRGRVDGSRVSALVRERLSG